MRRLIQACAYLLVLVMISAVPARAQLLDEIIKRGKVQIAVDTGTPPFGVTDANMQPDGADIDVAKLIAKDLGVTLEMVPVTGPNRVPFLQVVSIFGITPERAKAVAFSIPYVARGNIMDIELTATAPEGRIFQRYDDEASSNAALLAGQVDAIGIPDHTGGLLARQNPDKQLESKFVTRLSPYGIGIKRGDSDLLQWLNTFVFFHKNNGDLAKIYEKWVGSPLPDLATF